METEINIVEILKDKPQGTKLYSSACGKCKLEEVDDIGIGWLCEGQFCEEAQDGYAAENNIELED